MAGLPGGVPSLLPMRSMTSLSNATVGAGSMNSSAPDALDTLELGLLHAAPLVWRQGGMLVRHAGLEP
jgi:hypothetical protein